MRHLALWLCLLCAPASAEPARLLYFGDMAGAQILGRPAPALACANCHGRNAAGGGEGRLEIPPIDPAQLVARYGHYDIDTFAAALRTGRGGDGRVLSPAMPRFPSATATELAGLWSFLQGLAQEERTGITTTGIRFVVPSLPGQEAAAEALRDALERHWRPQGRIYNRDVRFDLAVVDGLNGDLAPGFAAISPVLDAEGRLARAARLAGLPVLAPQGAVETAIAADTVFIQARPVDVDRPLRALVAPAAHGGPAGDGIARTGTGDFIVFSAPDAARLASLPAPALAGRQVYLAARTAPLAAEALATLRSHGAALLIVQPAGDDAPAEIRAEVLASSLAQALRSAGRDLTRTRLLTAWGKVRVELPGWPPLDYRRVPASGTRDVITIRIAP